MPAIQPNTDYKILNGYTQKYWTVQGGVAEEGSFIVQFAVPTEASQANQRFQFENAGEENIYYIKTTPEFGNFYVTVCVQEGPQSVNNGTLTLSQQQDNYSTFNITVNALLGISPIINVTTSMYAEIKENSTLENAYVVVYYGNLGQQEDQLWHIIPYQV